MRTLLLLLIACSPLAGIAQFNLKKLGDKVNQKVNQRVERKTDKAIDKELDKVENAASGTAQTQTSGSQEPEAKSTGEAKSNLSSGGGLKSYSKFDFVPGQQIIYAEDFSQDVIGEFPTKWNTDGSGEIVTIDNVPGRWLDLTAGTKYETPYEKILPENYTIEFDMLVKMAENRVVPTVSINLDDQKGGSNYYPLAALTLSPNGGTNASDETSDRVHFNSYQITGTVFLNGKDQLIGEFTKANGKTVPVHIAIWVQKQRYRAWINGVKVYDLPKGISPDVKPDKISFHVGSYGSERTNYGYYISNIKVAQATPDTRSKLITEGKWSTNGILFDVNSDKIKPASYGVLKEIAAMLNENPGVRVKIVGHTDSDGDDAKNLDLSKRRAAAVKAALAAEFKIDAAGMETDGVGETKPVADNKVPEGKAQNRRVEFIKL